MILPFFVRRSDGKTFLQSSLDLVRSKTTQVVTTDPLNDNESHEVKLFGDHTFMDETGQFYDIAY